MQSAALIPVWFTDCNMITQLTNGLSGPGFPHEAGNAEERPWVVSAIAAGHPVAASLTAALTGAAASAEGYTAATAAATAQLWEYMPPIPKPPPYRLHPPVNMGGRSLIPFQPPGPSHDRMIVWTRLMNSNGPPRHSRSLSQPHTTRARTKPRPPDLPTHVAQQQMRWQHGHAPFKPI